MWYIKSDYLLTGNSGHGKACFSTEADAWRFVRGLPKKGMGIVRYSVHEAEYCILWVDNHSGVAGRGQPAFVTEEEALANAKAMNEQYNGQIVHGVAKVEKYTVKNTKYYVGWVNSNGYAGYGQPVFPTKEAAVHYAQSNNRRHIWHGVACI